MTLETFGGLSIIFFITMMNWKMTGLSKIGLDFLSTVHNNLFRWASASCGFIAREDDHSHSIQFKLLKFHVYLAICEVLEARGRVTEAVECFGKIQDELSQETSTSNQPSQWEQGEWLQEGR
jgi:hypothetical protein